ncbi:MAG TPA: hypothetical protein VLW06_13755 [Terriglobales bacterium]|nr:hypothetical protein [Terriglobales bacterium]
MSIEKKSLISNRAVTKKALATKPGVTKVANMRVTHATKAAPRLAAGNMRVATKARLAGGLARIKAQ